MKLASELSWIQKWILYSTLLAVFSSRFIIFVGGLSLFYFYFTTLINLGLLTAMGYLWVPRKLRYFLLYLLLSGAFGLLAGTNATGGFIKSWLGISICAAYSATFMRFVRFNCVALFRAFAHIAFFAAVLGFILLFLPGSTGRLTSLFIEPSSFAMVCTSALYYYADQWQRNRRFGLRMLTLLFACLLTFSSVGYFGMMFGLFLFGMRYRVGRVLVPGFVALVFSFALSQSTMFQVRVADTLLGLRSQDVAGLNQSSFGVVSNLFVTRKQFAEHPILGGGLGSHGVAHERFFDSIPGAFYIPQQLRTLGQFDASSLLLRITSELGIVGLVGAFWFLIYYFPRAATPEERAVSMAILCYVFMKFCRSGEYFGSEQFFFLSIYTMVGVKARLRVQKARPVIVSVDHGGDLSSVAGHLTSPA